MTVSDYDLANGRHRRFLVRFTVLAERISCPRVGEQLDSSTTRTDEGVKVEEALPQFCPVSEEEMSGPAGSSRPEWNITHVPHFRVAA